MPLPSSLSHKIEAHFQSAVTSAQRLGGGDSSEAFQVKLTNGQILFVKTNLSKKASCLVEKNGLDELQKAAALPIAQPLWATNELLTLQWEEPCRPPPTFWETFGKQFAQLHRFSSPHFGFYEDNWIGQSPQYNKAQGTERTSWTAFYWNKRLMPQWEMAEKRGYVTTELRKGRDQLEKRLPTLLSGTEEPPALLHGDLWSGNYLSTQRGAVLIDPATYYGHREADLAMTTLFGGFPSIFYSAYNEAYPLLPGYEDRIPIYQLYHLLNHLNIFGTGYAAQTLHTLKAVL